MADIIQINENTWRLEDGFVRFFLLEGKVKDAWKKVRGGEVPFEMVDMFGNKVKSYTTDVCGFFTE